VRSLSEVLEILTKVTEVRQVYWQRCSAKQISFHDAQRKDWHAPPLHNSRLQTLNFGILPGKFCCLIYFIYYQIVHKVQVKRTQIQTKKQRYRHKKGTEINLD